MENVLVIGAMGQIGIELTAALRLRYGWENVVAADIHTGDHSALCKPYEQLNVMDSDQLKDCLRRHDITQVYHLAAMLSAKGEINPKTAWSLNVDGLLNVLDACVERGVKKLFWPSSISVFGPEIQKINCPQENGSVPTTIYGISKVAGEQWCQYYHHRHGLDIRSLRFPGLISHKAMPGGGTTDYAVDIFHHALAGKPYDCYLKSDTFLPMMYMDDAVRAVLELMDTPEELIKIRTAYNLSAMSFSPKQLHTELKKYFPNFKVRYRPDVRQAIADSWPYSINDTESLLDWGWEAQYNLKQMTAEMLRNLRTVSGTKEEETVAISQLIEKIGSQPLMS
ncbi:NAD-dependent epimerase/dehydratase family protein [Pedobacter aquatilis]|uniref:NAD-dependent epimerase/dehydratase family protein n=1 Tax=Pedobacter aquatilis TaxID=351343 RepID=UPI00292D34B5|nr:NAD-dependent epimerase/dehydratase family protein [Pedobacter aquatilis]